MRGFLKWAFDMDGPAPFWVNMASIFLGITCVTMWVAFSAYMESMLVFLTPLIGLGALIVAEYRNSKGSDK